MHRNVKGLWNQAEEDASDECSEGRVFPNLAERVSVRIDNDPCVAEHGPKPLARQAADQRAVAGIGDVVRCSKVDDVAGLDPQPYRIHAFIRVHVDGLFEAEHFLAHVEREGAAAEDLEGSAKGVEERLLRCVVGRPLRRCHIGLLGPVIVACGTGQRC